MEGGERTWRFTGFYGAPERNRRHETWNLLKNLAPRSPLPWVVMGDFNDVLNSDEKRGDQPQPNWLIEGFKEAIEGSDLRDFEFQ